MHMHRHTNNHIHIYRYAYKYMHVDCQYSKEVFRKVLYKINKLKIIIIWRIIESKDLIYFLKMITLLLKIKNFSCKAKVKYSMSDKKVEA